MAEPRYSCLCNQLALLAAVEGAALATPGIESAHWLARAFWLSGMAIAVCGVLLGALMCRSFYLFFAEDMVDSRPLRMRLNLSTNAMLIHHVADLFATPSMVRPLLSQDHDE